MDYVISRNVVNTFYVKFIFFITIATSSLLLPAANTKEPNFWRVRTLANLYHSKSYTRWDTRQRWRCRKRDPPIHNLHNPDRWNGGGLQGATPQKGDEDKEKTSGDVTVTLLLLLSSSLWKSFKGHNVTSALSLRRRSKSRSHAIPLTIMVSTQTGQNGRRLCDFFCTKSKSHILN